MATFFKVFVLLISCYCQFALAYTDAEIEGELANEARRQSANLPYESKGVKLMSVYAGPGRRVTYSAIIKGNLSSIRSPQWAAQRRRMLVNNYCTNPQFKNFIEDLVTVSWHDMDVNGVSILVTDVSKSDCKNR